MAEAGSEGDLALIIGDIEHRRRRMRGEFHLPTRFRTTNLESLITSLSPRETITKTSDFGIFSVPL